MEPETDKTLVTFRASTSNETPPAGLSAPLTALWWAAKDNWDEAHTLVQGDDSADAAWIHAYLHRLEGDESNARYWYGRAGRDPTKATLETEWIEIAEALLRTTN